MGTELKNPYVCPEPTVLDIWELDADKEKDVGIQVMLPNGYFMCLAVNREATLMEIKEEVWEKAQNCPLFRLLKDSECYVFQCINLSTAERDELADEERRLCEVRPFQGVLRLVEKEGDKAEKILNSRLRYVVGQDTGLWEYEEKTNSEVSDFRKGMKAFCDSVSDKLDQDTLEKRMLAQYPCSIESAPELPQYLQGKLHPGNRPGCSNLVLTVNFQHQSSETTFKFSLEPHMTASQLFELILKRKGPTIEMFGSSIKNSVLKICGFEEYLIGPYPLSQYKYIHDCLACNKIPELVLVPSDTIHLESPLLKKTSDKCGNLGRSRSIRSEIDIGKTRETGKKVATVSAWTIEQPLCLTVHSVQGCPQDSKTKIAVQCGIYHGDENLCNTVQTSDKIVEDGKSVWDETVQFDLDVCNLPRMAKLCLCIYEASSTQKNVRFRKCEEGYACPLAWVNTSVFDYKGVFKSSEISLTTWAYNRDGDDYSTVMLRPLGCLVSNPNKDHNASITVSFGKYPSSNQVVFPSSEEILEYAEDSSDSCNSHVYGSPQASKSHLEQLRQICEKDSLYQLHEQEKELMWFLRNDCSSQLPECLPKLLRCGKWNDRRDIAQMVALIQDWPKLSPCKALELLDYAYPDPFVRSFAVDCLRPIGDGELSLHMLQLVQALKHEAYLESDLVKFLMERALQNRHNGHKMFWLLRSEINFPEVFIRFGLILEAYCRNVPSHLEALGKQVEAFRRLMMVNHLVQNDVNVKKEGREKLKCLIQDLLGRSPYQNLFKGLQNPLDPRLKFGKLKEKECKFLDSKMKPLWLSFENADSHGKDVFIIFKNGDDLRQDMLTLQMIRIMDRLWKEEGLDLRMIPYQCLATGHKVGLIEVVPDADTIANIQKKKGFTATSAFQKGSILSWLKDYNSDENSLNKAYEEFTLSCAGYCVATYVLGVADRHSDNIMVKTNGQLFHIDFGHILGKFKEKFGFKRERVPFVLTNDFVHIITKGSQKDTQRSQEFLRFQQFCERAFMILRRKGPLIISLFAMMLSTGIPELSSEKDLDYLRDTLVLDMSEPDALKHFRSKFVEALNNSWKTSLMWMAHNWAKDNKMTEKE